MRSLFLKILLIIFVLILISILVGVDTDSFYSVEQLKEIREMSVNKVTLLGFVGKDPEVKTFDNGGKIANFNLATTERGFTTKDGKEIPEKTEWHMCSVGGGLAKVVENYVHKGDRLYLEGKLATRSYKDANGVEKYITEIKVAELEMLSNKGSQGSTQQPQQQSQQQTQKQRYTQQPEANYNNDLPF